MKVAHLSRRARTTLIVNALKQEQGESGPTLVRESPPPDQECKTQHTTPLDRLVDTMDKGGMQTACCPSPKQSPS